jgi:hypothetical protein
MSTTTFTLSMSTSSTPPFAERALSEKTKLQLPPAAWFFLISTSALAGGAWFSLRSDVTRQGAAIEANRVEAQRQITELRTDTKESLGILTAEQKSQRDLLIRIDENIKRLPR